MNHALSHHDSRASHESSAPVKEKPDRLWDEAPIFRSIIRGLALALAGTAAAVALVLLVLGRVEWWQGFLAAATLSVLAAAAALVPLKVGVRFGMLGALAGHFVAIVLRLLVVLGGALLLVNIGDYPATPVLLLCVPFYFALLAGEAITLARVFWERPAIGDGADGSDRQR